MAIFFPLQGFWNALIYFRIPYQQQHGSRRSQVKKGKRKTRLTSSETRTSTPKQPELPFSNSTPKLSSSAPAASKGPEEDAASKTIRPSGAKEKQQESPEVESELEEGRCNKSEKKAKPFRFSTEQRFGWNMALFSKESQDGEQEDPLREAEEHQKKTQQTLSEDEQLEM
jgi:hypothetical protein